MTRTLLNTLSTKKAVGALATVITGLTLAAGPAAHAATAHTTTPALANTPAVAMAVQADTGQPVAGLDQTQLNNAKHIIDTAKQMGLSDRAQIIAVATAMQESKLYNLASTAIPDSYNYDHQGEGSDYDSVGLFQQRPNWGSTQDLMNPDTSAKKFYQALTQVPGWDTKPVTVAAQQVQGSAYPDAYAPHEGPATDIVHALNK